MSIIKQFFDFIKRKPVVNRQPPPRFVPTNSPEDELDEDEGEPKGISDIPTRPMHIDSRTWEELTHRRREIASMVCRGMTNRQIAAKLHLSEHTVRSHLYFLFNTFGVKKRQELQRLVQNSHIDLDEIGLGDENKEP